MAPRAKLLRAARAALLLAALSAGSPAAAESKADPSIAVNERVQKLDRLIAELGRQINQLHAAHTMASLQQPVHELQSRLNDAQIAYQLRDYFQASIIFFDIVEEPRYRRDAQGYEEALYYLADSLYQNRNFLAARRYFGDLMQSYPRSRFYQDALSKVVSMALVTGRHDEVDGFYMRLVQSAPGTQIAPELPYLYAKSLYQRREFDRALSAFATVAQQSPFFLRARFYMAGLYVAQGKGADAIKVLTELLAQDPTAVRGRDDVETRKLVADNREILQMARLGIGRVYFDAGDLARASDAYQEVHRKSAQFPEALFELAWVAIKGKQYEKARRTLELLMLSRLDSQTLPEAQVLLGDLQLLLNRGDDAAKTYGAVKATFEPIRKELADHISKHADPVRYFNALLAGKLDRMDPSAMLPPVATRWVQTGERVTTAMQVVRDLGMSRDQLLEARKIVTRLEAALEAPDKLEMFPLLRDARATALELENKHLRAKLELTFLESMLISDQVAPNELAAVDRAKDARKLVEAEFNRVPMTKEDYLKRREAQMARVSGLESEAHKVGIQIDGIKAQLVAAIKYWQDTKKLRPISEADEKTVFAKIDAEKAELAQLQVALDKLREDIVAQRARAGVGDEAVVLDDAVRGRLSVSLDDERKAMSPLRLRLAGSRYDAVKRIEGLRNVVDRHIAALGGFRVQLARMVTDKAEEFRQRILREKKLLEIYEGELHVQERSSEQVVGGVAYDTYKRVQRKFYDLVIGADRGLVELVWREKDKRAREVEQLKANRKVELKHLDQEFQDVLRAQ